MVFAHTINTLLLLAGSSAAAPRWWMHQGPGDLAKQAQAVSSASVPAPTNTPTTSIAVQQQNVQAVYTPPPGGVVSNGILYLTTTVYLQPGQSPPEAAATSAPAAPAPAAASPPAQNAPPAQVSNQAPASSPAAQTLATSVTQNQAAASPAASPASASNSGSAGSITADMILAVAPQSGSCSGAEYPDECATAAQAAPALNTVFAKYGINTKGAQAAVIAYEMWESGQLKYKVNKFPAPGNPGQGTRIMMQPNYVSEYASAVAGADKVAAAGSPAAVLALVNSNDELSFGAGAWFLKTKCPDLIAQFDTAADATWNTFMTSCARAGSEAGRTTMWNAAKVAVGV